MNRCISCKFYQEDREDETSHNGTGWCKKPRVEKRPRRTHLENSCQDYVRRKILEQSNSPEGPGDDDDRKLGEPGNTRSLHAYEGRLEMDGIKIVVFWNSDTQEITVSCYLEGESRAALSFMADLCGDRSRRTYPILFSVGDTEHAAEGCEGRDTDNID